ncbi:hypothetical protein SAMN05444156_3255 [Verrucomicrobium sp. GAS474]|nr:hypothetical protein SAMN05444156_0017 [Verrucomicrobium sp. GAS474]SDU31673.1 hypothetical protein SAMN05444156_3255 [Verrucomicrobium sp. GAS474]
MASHKPKALIPAHRREGMRDWRFKTSEIKVWWAAAYNGAALPKGGA